MSKRPIFATIWAGIASLAGGTFRMFNVRRTWLINPAFQARIILFGVSIGGFALTLTYLSIKYFFYHSNMMLAQPGMPANGPITDFLAEQERLMDGLFLVIICFTVFFSSVLGIFLSHRVAGPMYRMRKHLEAIAAGAPPSRVKFRDNDFFQDVATAYNSTLEKPAGSKSADSEPTL